MPSPRKRRSDASPIIGGKRQRFSVAQLVTALEPRPEQRPSEAIDTAVSSSPWVDDYVPSPITVEEARGFRVEYYWAQEIFATNHNMIMAIEGDGGAHDMPVPRYICPPSQMAQRQLRASNEGAVAEAGPSSATAANEMAEIDVWDPPGDYDVNYAEEATEILNSAILQDEPPSPETEVAEARRRAMAAFLNEHDSAPRPLRPVSRAPQDPAPKAFHPRGWRFPRANISTKKSSYDSGPGDDTRLDGPSRATKKRTTERRIGFFYADWFEYMSDEARPESDYWPSAQLLSHADSRGPRPLVGAEWMLEWRRQVNLPWVPEYGRPEYGPSYVEGDDIEIVGVNDVEQDKSSEGSLGTGKRRRGED